ncbi:MAG: G/U mismatch-specific DNA glycosylase [Deltaproteobacteria bacterium]
MQNLPDYLRPGLKIIFVGFNPGLRSAEIGHHFASPSNRFWKILLKAGLTPRLYQAEEDGTLLELGYGLTNIVARPSRAAADISREEYLTGARILSEKIARYRPETVCYVGKGVYQSYSGKKAVDWGFQKESTIGGVYDFVAPSSSGLVRMSTEEIIAVYQVLASSLTQEK